MVLAGIKDRAYTAAAARHISADGCQLVLGEANAAPGQRFRFDLAGFAPIIGTVRWIVADRAGFAFDQPLCSDSQRALAGRDGGMRGLELFLA